MGPNQLVEEVILLALFLVSTAGNTLALLVFYCRPGLRTTSNRFVINLLATNLVTTCLLAPALFGEYSALEDKHIWWCATEAAAAAFSLAALLAVLLIALDQHHAVIDPLRCHTRLLQRRPAALCAATWALVFLAAAARAVIAALRQHYDTEAIKYVDLMYAIVYLVAGVLTPAVIVCVIYARIYKAARSSGLRARAQGASALQLHEPPINLPDLVEEGEGLTLRIDVGPFLLPPENPRRCPSVASLRQSKKDAKSNEDLRKLPSVSSAPLLAVPVFTGQRAQRTSSGTGSRITSIRYRISNASLFRYGEESRAARVGLVTGGLAMLHVPHAVVAAVGAVAPDLAEAARVPALALLLAAAAASPFLFALRSRTVQQEARRLLLPEKSLWSERNACSAAAAAAAVSDGQRARSAFELLRSLSPGSAEAATTAEAAGGACRGSFSSGGSTQLSSASDE